MGLGSLDVDDFHPASLVWSGHGVNGRKSPRNRSDHEEKTQPVPLTGRTVDMTQNLVRLTSVFLTLSTVACLASPDAAPSPASGTASAQPTAAGGDAVDPRGRWLAGSWTREAPRGAGELTVYDLSPDGTGEYTHVEYNPLSTTLSLDDESNTTNTDITWNSDGETFVFNGSQQAFFAVPNCRVIKIGSHFYGGIISAKCPFESPPLSPAERSLAGTWYDEGNGPGTDPRNILDLDEDRTSTWTDPDIDSHGYWSVDSQVLRLVRPGLAPWEYTIDLHDKHLQLCDLAVCFDFYRDPP
jgi:hypothetical protein